MESHVVAAAFHRRTYADVDTKPERRDWTAAYNISSCSLLADKTPDGELVSDLST